MMNYEIFKEVLKEKFLDYMPEKYRGMEIVISPVEKVNMTLYGLSLRNKGTNISPTIYVNDKLYNTNIHEIIEQKRHENDKC